MRFCFPENLTSQKQIKHAPAETHLIAYTSLIRPKLEYAAMIWDLYIKLTLMPHK